MALSSEEAEIFLREGLDKDLNKARARLLGLKETPFYSKKKNLTHYHATGTSSEETRAKHLRFINDSIVYVLELIGEYSNARFGKSAAQQHRFFSRPTETEAFFLHLYGAIQSHKQKMIESEPSEASKIMPDTKIHDWSAELRRFEDRHTCYFQNSEVQYQESQLYAAGVFYLTSFLLEDALVGQTKRVTSRFVEVKNHFKNGILYRAVDSAKGGSESGKTRKTDFEYGYEIFKESNIYVKYVNENGHVKVESILEELSKLLSEAGICKSEETLRTRWAKAYIERYKQEIISACSE